MPSETVNPRVLVIDDNEAIHEDFRQILSGQARVRPGLAESKQALLGIVAPRLMIPVFQVDTATDGLGGLQKIVEARAEQNPFTLTFVDVRMPTGWDGVETTLRILHADPEIQVILCTAFSDYSLEEILRRFGGDDRVMLLKKPFDVVETMLLAVSLTRKWQLTCEANRRKVGRVGPVADTRRVLAIIEDCLNELDGAHDELRSHAVQLTSRLQQRTVEVLGTRDLAMFALAQLADSRDPETGEHLQRMRAYAQLLAQQLAKHGPYTAEIDAVFLKDFFRSTPLHDIGKVGIPDQILLKPGRLSEEEFEIMKQHTVIGAEALGKAASQNPFGGFLGMAAKIARSHHERFDGDGYPDGLEGDDIPLPARITALADVFDALTSPRVYKEAMPPDEARLLIERQSGKHFDPAVVMAFQATYDEFLRVKRAIDGAAEQDVQGGSEQGESPEEWTAPSPPRPQIAGPC